MRCLTQGCLRWTVMVEASVHSLGCIIRTLQTSPDKASKLTLCSLMPTVGDWDKMHAQRNLLLNRGSVQIVSITYFHVRIKAFPNIRGCYPLMQANFSGQKAVNLSIGGNLPILCIHPASPSFNSNVSANSKHIIRHVISANRFRVWMRTGIPIIVVRILR